MCKWNDPKHKDTKVKNYYSMLSNNPNAIEGTVEFLENFQSSVEKHPVYAALVRGLLHGANIASSKSGEVIFEDHIKETNEYDTCVNKTIKENNNKHSNRKSNMDIYLVDKKDPDRNVYIEFKDGGENGTYDSAYKADDYLNRIVSSSVSEAYIIVTERSQTYNHYSDIVSRMNKNNKSNIKIECIEIGSERFRKLFPRFNVSKFRCALNKHAANKVIENINNHIETLEVLNNNNNRRKQ